MPNADEPDIPVLWFDELLATYFAYAYVAQTDSAWASASRREWASHIRGFTPQVLSLDWSFTNGMSGPELSRTYGWYQFVLNQRAAQLYDRYGIAILPRLKDALPWASASGWTSGTLLDHLDAVVPALASWAREFGRE